MNLTLNLKIFQRILFHLHGNHKQDIKGECDPNIQIGLFKKMLVCENFLKSTFNSAKSKFVVLLQCDRQSYIKHILSQKQNLFVEPDIINYVSLY